LLCRSTPELPLKCRFLSLIRPGSRDAKTNVGSGDPPPGACPRRATTWQCVSSDGSKPARAARQFPASLRHAGGPRPGSFWPAVCLLARHLTPESAESEIEDLLARRFALRQVPGMMRATTPVISGNSSTCTSACRNEGSAAFSTTDEHSLANVDGPQVELSASIPRAIPRPAHDRQERP
jgi:hypothetical protein